MKGTLLRIVAAGALAGSMLVIALPASAAVPPPHAPVVSVANPHPGDYLRRGATWVTGEACDPNAPLTDSTGGISRVAVFLGDRDTGIGVPWYRPGGYFGAALSSSVLVDFSANVAQTSRLGLGNPDTSICKNPAAGWRVLPSSFRKGIYDMNVYVTGKNGAETKVTIAGLRVDHP